MSVPTDKSIQRTIQMRSCNRMTTGTYMYDGLDKHDIDHKSEPRGYFDTVVSVSIRAA